MYNIQFDKDAQLFWLAGPNPELEHQMDLDHERLPGRLQWKPKKLGLVAKVKSFTTAVTSGFATPEVMAQRRLSCFGPPKCPALFESSDGKYCGVCSCNRWKLAELDGTYLPKLNWATVDCPLRRPGFSNEKSP